MIAWDSHFLRPTQIDKDRAGGYRFKVVVFEGEQSCHG